MAMMLLVPMFAATVLVMASIVSPFVVFIVAAVVLPMMTVPAAIIVIRDDVSQDAAGSGSPQYDPGIAI